MKSKKVILKQGKEKPILHRHHWIFSGAIAELPPFENGECLPVHAFSGAFLGWAYFNKNAKIIGRMLNFEDKPPQQSLIDHCNQALALRKTLFNEKITNAYRVINGEGDLLPGLIIDKYDDYLAIQISTFGMQKLKPLIIDWASKTFNPKGIYEKSRLPSRKEEGLPEEEGILQGHIPNEIEILENGLKFHVSIKEGQKTGFFLDHREMRHWIGQFSKGRRVLNCFSYTGGFSVYAAASGAADVTSVDISSQAVKMVETNLALNGLKPQNNIAEDVFEFLRKDPLNYDLVILDPPAFAKRQKDVIPACRGYKDINRLAMQKMPKNSLLLTCSCSYHVDEELFQKVVFQAATEAGRTVKIIGRHRMALDHPINICHPEGDYLKSLFLFIE